MDRYAKGLAGPSALQELHPRAKHRPTKGFLALAPAMVFGTSAAFEGFVEEWTAVIGGKRGLSYAQIVKLAHANSPSLRDFLDGMNKQVPIKSDRTWQAAFSVEVWSPPALTDSNWWTTENIGWEAALDQADAWLQVRHCLAHGLTRGYLSENWPGPVRSGVLPASTVLRPQKEGRHSLTLHGAITCARVLRYGAEAIATASALALNEKPPRWRAVPAFPLVSPTAADD